MAKKSRGVVEVIGIVDSGGPSGGPGSRTKWALGMQFSHWRIIDGGIESIPLYVKLDCSEKELDAWMKSINARNMIRMQVRFTRSIVPEQRRANIVKIIGKDRSDSELRAAAKDRRTTSITDAYFKKLKLDRDHDTYTCQAKWRAKAVEIIFETDKPKTLETLCRKVEKFWKGAVKEDARLREVAVRYMLDQCNEWRWDEEEKPVTAKQFASRLKLRSVRFEKTGAFEFIFDDGDLFQGHEIVVFGNVKSGPKRADLLG